MPCTDAQYGSTNRAGRFFETARTSRPCGGFTMIELIVVIGIIILAAGMMTPSITDFFKGRQLRQLMNSVRSTINSARLKAVNERTQVRLVFFREGIRVFDERVSDFVDEFFDPEGSPLAGDESWYVLGFYNGVPSVRLPRYREWEEEHRVPASETRGGERPSLRLQDLAGLPQIVFRRDGSVEFSVGADVSSIFFKRDPPSNADLILYNKGNASACFIDIQVTGQNRSRLEVLEEEPQPPGDGGSEEEPSGRKGARKRGSSSRRG